jgi:cytochrome c oxidase assembly factor CtaG
MFAMFFVSGLIGLLALLIIAPLVLLAFVFWIWMLVNAIQNKGLSDGEKVGWVLAIVFLHFIGALLYFFIGRPKRI